MQLSEKNKLSLLINKSSKLGRLKVNYRKLSEEQQLLGIDF